MNSQSGNHGVQARHPSHRPFALRRGRAFLEKNDRRRGAFDDAARGFHGTHGGNTQAFLRAFEFPASGSAQLGVVANQQNGVFPGVDHLFLAAFFFAAEEREGSRGDVASRTSRTFSVSSSTRKGFSTWGRRLRSRKSRVRAARTSPVTNR